MVLKSRANDMRHLALCHDEFRGPRSDLCRSGGIGNNNNTFRNLMFKCVLCGCALLFSKAPTVLALCSPRTIKASCPAEHCKWRPTADGKSFEPSEETYTTAQLSLCACAHLFRSMKNRGEFEST
ncbi:hypothetical protein TNCV_4887321 [Trichonephila clavipes]|nr:hypothetical protein TNCV_4887321 [Trichonephila clavipes]